jgi:hypothetical protein
MMKVSSYTSERRKKKEALISARYAPMYIPNTSWDFFDAFNNSLPCQLAFQDNQASLDGRNLDWYLKLHRKQVLDEEKNKANNKPIRVLPNYLKHLLSLQDSSGRFLQLLQIYKALDMPILDLSKVRRFDVCEEWELATALAMVILRQHHEYFEELYEYYNKAFQWIRYEELLEDMKIVIHDYLYKEEEDDPDIHTASNIIPSTIDTDTVGNSTISSVPSTAREHVEVEEEDVDNLVKQYTDNAAEDDIEVNENDIVG